MHVFILKFENNFFVRIAFLYLILRKRNQQWNKTCAIEISLRSHSLGKWNVMCFFPMLWNIYWRKLTEDCTIVQTHKHRRADNIFELLLIVVECEWSLWIIKWRWWWKSPGMHNNTHINAFIFHINQSAHGFIVGASLHTTLYDFEQSVRLMHFVT